NQTDGVALTIAVPTPSSFTLTATKPSGTRPSFTLIAAAQSPRCNVLEVRLALGDFSRVSHLGLFEQPARGFSAACYTFRRNVWCSK
ncbi:MAG TPA: hypothetical protein VMR88_13905, partial [Candidatus Polarisedimenticolaceae bacterium]|nr:hypothetical protein [Candidatus Polarisedimenticolaceae bacterium]